MQTAKSSDWRLPVLIVGMALAAFFLGSTTTIWLSAKLMPSLTRAAASAQGTVNTVVASQPAGSAVDSAQSTAVPATAAGSGSGEQPPAGKAASVAQKPVSPVSAPAATSPAAPQPSSYSLQLGAFLDAAKAKLLADQRADPLAARGYSPALIDGADGSGRTWHYVRFGVFPDERTAALAASDLLEKAGIGSVVVRASSANAGD